MSAPAAERWGAASGFAVIVVSAAAMVFERGAVLPADSADAVVAHYTGNRGAIFAQSMLFLAGAALYLWFLGSLRSFLLRAEGGTGRVSAIAFGAGVVWIGLSALAQAFQIGLAAAPAAAALPALIATMNAVFTISALPLAVLLAAVAAVTWRHHAFPAWLGWVAVVAAGAQILLWSSTVVGSGPLAADGWLSYALYPVFLVWLVPATVVMTGRSRRSPGPDRERPE
ncbi:hypothetical protein [Amycolatopsis sp. cg9]|uniref:hypothetical protein n=1 Tax=Amycolatopsis sp. cg9 TaxID=3238801 RepID=UPI003523995A